MNSIDSVSGGSNVIHLNSVNSVNIVNISVQAVYITVLPPSLMVFLYYVVLDTFSTFQNGMENNYYCIQINHIHKLHSKENGIDHIMKRENATLLFPISQK